MIDALDMGARIPPCRREVLQFFEPVDDDEKRAAKAAGLRCIYWMRRKTCRVTAYVVRAETIGENIRVFRVPWYLMESSFDDLVSSTRGDEPQAPTACTRLALNGSIDALRNHQREECYQIRQRSCGECPRDRA